MTQSDQAPPLVAHVIDRLVIGGMENGIVNIINGTPAKRFRHAIICLRYADDFRTRLRNSDVEIFQLGKAPGKDFRVYFRLWRLLRRLRPAIVHTRNLPAADLPPVVAAAGVPWRVHGEHGRDVSETYGTSAKYNTIRRLVSPFVHRYIAVSKDLEAWLQDSVGVPAARVRQIYNGVDTDRFYPARGRRDRRPLGVADEAETIVIGTVGRMEAIKDQLTLVRAFIRLSQTLPDGAAPVRLAIVGTGTLLEPAQEMLQAAGLAQQAWLPGARNDIPDLLRAMDVFVLPSINEGISNTIIEAMATGLPVVATDVGGNAELVVEGQTGTLVPAQDPESMAKALLSYVVDPGRRAAHGVAGRQRVDQTFSLDDMIEAYLSQYDSLLGRKASAVSRGRGLVDTEV